MSDESQKPLLINFPAFVRVKFPRLIVDYYPVIRLALHPRRQLILAVFGSNRPQVFPIRADTPSC